MATIDALLTAEEFFQLPDQGVGTELSRGKVIELKLPSTRHGQVCGEILLALYRHIEVHGLGRLVCNCAGFVTRRNPDSVRGPDISFYGDDQFPTGPMPSHYTDVAPRLVVEVLSPSDSWGDVLEKLGEYLHAGVMVACVVDPQTETVQVFHADRAPVTLSGEDELKLPEVLGTEFTVPVKRFFE